MNIKITAFTTLGLDVKSPRISADQNVTDMFCDRNMTDF